MWIGTNPGNYSATTKTVWIANFDSEYKWSVNPVKPVLQTKVFVDAPETLICGKRG